jgi:hypothetical protein
MVRPKGVLRFVITLVIRYTMVSRFVDYLVEWHCIPSYIALIALKAPQGGIIKAH